MNEIVDLSGAEWRKSTYSGMQNDCVEVASVTGRVAARDSKDPMGPALVFSRDAWAAFVKGVVSGELDNA